MSQQKEETKIQAESFEKAMESLEQIVQELEKGSLPLQEALTAFQKGIALSQYCQKELSEAEETVTKMMTENGLQNLDEEAL